MQLVVAGTLTHYEDLNPQQPDVVLVLPGWAHTSQHWLTVARLLPTTHRYILLDLPGFGQTQFIQGKLDVPQYADFVAHFIQKLKLKKPILLGHSFGGQIALYLALTEPKLISQLILLSPAGIRTKSRLTRARIGLLKLFKRFRALLPPALYNALLRRIASADYAAALGKQRQLLNHIVNFDLLPRLPEITVPTIILWGDQDRVIPYMGKLMAETLPHARLVVLYGAGHIPHLTHPELLAAELKNILLYD